MFNDKSVLITGGTGSFGHRFVSYLLDNFTPKKIIIYSRDELKQFEMQQKYDAKCMRYFIGDVRDKERLKAAMRDVDYVVHAAALKQVPAAEYNPNECIKTNIHGAQNVIDAAIETNVSRIVALSTDKAANPVNLYGATKLASDKLFVAANNISGATGPRFSVVRYGNVVGSRGSVVPFFRNLLQDGTKQLPITHLEMTRFWITLNEGIEFVVKSFERMRGGEIFVPKIPSVKITDLAFAMSNSKDFDVVGIRPGEKLHEVMVPEEVSHHTLEFHDHYVITPPIIFFDKDIDYSLNKIGETGTQVDEKFEYNSGTNPHFLTIDEINQLNQENL